MGDRGPSRTWPVPRATRHVWVRAGDTSQAAPTQGFVIEWRRHGHRWWASVIMVGKDEHGRPRSEARWVELEHLTPVRSDPGTGDRVRHLG